MREEELSLAREIEPLSKRWFPRWYYVLAGGQIEAPLPGVAFELRPPTMS